ncbi:hypothetical protein BACSTE_03124 [Bacteroides stercoris ATCC 43183]|uniref:Uncharacterized protein n=1 Tax=Bacteroides stercoris ATCC 43183 TaxID=449673 RepID=B0NUD9_BACSE|nr:hypothetical protein BACSTE_03124 [Bacteroides stercoris ATCC 43183]
MIDVFLGTDYAELRGLHGFILFFFRVIRVILRNPCLKIVP